MVQRTTRPFVAVELIAAILSFAIAALTPCAVAQQSIAITGDRLSGTVLPVEPLDGSIELTAMRATAWTVDDTKRLLLAGDVDVVIAGQAFAADAAAVWINRLPTAAGVVTQIAAFFDLVQNPTSGAGLGVAGGHLLVTASVRGDVTMEVALLEAGPARTTPFLARAERRLAHYRQLIEGASPDLAQRPVVDRPEPTDVFVPTPGRAVDRAQLELPETLELPALEARPPWLRDPEARVAFAFGRFDVIPGEDENVFTITDSIVVEYRATDPGDALSQITLSADRAVVFADPGTTEDMTRWEMAASHVRGIYLEGNVTASANEGEYALRAPRVYYDFSTGRAIMLKAVLRTYERDLAIPIYARAQEMRQIAESQWEAKSIKVTTSEFAVGHLALGADRMTISRSPVARGADDGARGAAGALRADRSNAPFADAASGDGPFIGSAQVDGGFAGAGGDSAGAISERAGGGDEGDAGMGAGVGTGGGAGTTGGAGSGERQTILQAKGITLEAGGVPFFGWPSFEGTVQDVPVKQVNVGSGKNVDLGVETRFDLFTLTGSERPRDVTGDLLLDGFFSRGAGGGVELDYGAPGGRSAYGEGALDLYGLYDEGTDLTSSGLEVESPRDFRGIALWEHEITLDPTWTLQLDGAYVSDPTFVTQWREDDFRMRREYESSAYLIHQKDRHALTLLAKGTFNDFLSNDYLLASQGYAVDSLPELGYRRYGDSLFGDRVTYSQETRVSSMRFAFEESTPNELGVPAAAFNVPAGIPVADGLLAQGLDEEFVVRLDTRHELAVPFDLGPVEISPYVVGRLTAYDQDFTEFRQINAPGGDNLDEKNRVFAALGLRASAQFQHVDDSVESRLLDLHRLRHIIEPSAHVWFGTANLSDVELPVYDLDVESLSNGAAFRLGVKNTWQTNRGGPGRWRSVDVFRTNLDVVYNSSDANVKSPTPQFFDYRPEYSQFGDHVSGSGAWMVSDAFSLSGRIIYALDESVIARGSIGAELIHTPLLRTFTEFRYIDASDSQLLDVGWIYEITPKYTLLLSPQWDFHRDEFRSVDVRVTRRFPDFNLTIEVKRDEIQDDTIVGASIGLVRF